MPSRTLLAVCRRADARPAAFFAQNDYARTRRLKLTHLAREIADGTFDAATIPHPAP